MLQMKVTKSYLTDWIEQEFANRTEATLQIGDLDGLIPFNIQLEEVKVLHREGIDSAAADTLVDIERINTSLDIWSLLQNRVSITGFSVTEPEIRLKAKEDGMYTLGDVFRGDTSRTMESGRWFPEVEIIAPEVIVRNGIVRIDKVYGPLKALRFPEPLVIEDFNSRMYLEITSRQLFWDIENLDAKLKGVKAGDLKVTGQVYNDGRYLEFNAFTLSAGSSRLNINGEVEGVSLYERKASRQLRDARYDIVLASQEINLNDFTDLYPDLPDIPKPIEFSLESEGVIDSLWVDRFTFGVGESYLNINGFFENLTDPTLLRYRFKMAEVVLQKDDLEIFTGPLNEDQYSLLNALQFNGKADGSRDSVDVNIDVQSPYGRLSLVGGSRLTEPYRYMGSLSGKELDISPLMGSEIDTTRFNFDASMQGTGLTLEDAVAEMSANVYASSINNSPFDSLDVNASLVSGFMETRYTFKKQEQHITGSGWADFSTGETRLAFKGKADNINLADYLRGAQVPESALDFDYNIETEGLTPDRIQGQANLDVKPSVVNGDSVRAHQLYMDLDSPERESRTFRLTSSLFDMTLKGSLQPTNIAAQVGFWSTYLEQRYREEISFEKSSSKAGVSGAKVDPMILEGEFTSKDLTLLKKYFPSTPLITSSTNLTFNVNADSEKLLLTARADTDSLSVREVDIRNSETQITATFRSDRLIKEFAKIDFVTEMDQFNSKALDIDSMRTEATLSGDTLTVTQEIESIAGDASMNMEVQTFLADTAVTVRFRDFYLGNDFYAWQNEGVPELVYDRNERLKFNHFTFRNRNEFLELRGTMSSSREDSVFYILRDISLDRISGLIEGRISFDGSLNGTFVTRSLTKSPSVEGDLTVNRLKLQDRLIGDASFKSSYDPSRKVFDTQIRVFTDSTKYGEYLDSNDDIGQNILLDGYFTPPDPGAEQDTAYYFDADMQEIDMWVIPLIADKIFEAMEGQASGRGYLTGNFNEIDFHADFDARNVYAKPRFLKTNYFLNGDIVLDRERGVVLDSVDVTDTKGGTGILWGTIDLNDFKPITFLDLNLSMDRLQFLNNDFQPDVPFYGGVSGTGQVRLTGANTDLYLQTVRPVSVTQESEISIPLIEETELNENNKFIRFVKEFDVDRRERLSLASGQVRETTADESTLEQAIDDLTFNERFNLDLQFNAPQNVYVNLIFDPVTGEILRAQGTGQLRITMQDEEVQMFGRYNISGGNYKFVSGEIISRKLTLERGGTIVWEGDPENARLDIQAVYNARPNIATLSAAGTEATRTNGTSQRVPIDLIIEITGTVSSVENDYYFRLSNSLELTSNSTLSLTLSQINRDEQQKFLQATSILLTGEFIPSESYGQATTSLTQSLTRGSTVINPLLSNQVISPLLSNQINSLLNSDVNRFDIDFNLNAYNEIDLGIALRLYNDRLILRREGQLTGGAQESTFGEKIGDLNATYRISRGLSVMAFHRQDQVLGSFSSGNRADDVTPSVDGVGLEATVQFNTWQELKRRIRNAFNWIFGIKDKDEKKENIASD